MAAITPVVPLQVYGNLTPAAPSIIVASSTVQPSTAAATTASTPTTTSTLSAIDTDTATADADADPTDTNTTDAASTTASATSTTETTASAAGTAIASTASAFDYTQIFNKAIREYTTSEVNDAPFHQLCPSGDCFEACQNFSLMLNSNTYQYNPTAELPTSFSTTNITLFGLCTNIANITSAVANTDALPDAARFFKVQNNSQYNVNKVVSGTAQCLLGTCEATRKPQECEPLCSPFILQESISAFNFVNTYKCITKLCDNTCGLPFANQDVFGVGVLSSCAIQAFIVLLYAIFCIVRMPRQNSYSLVSSAPKKGQTTKSKTDKVAERINTAASAFLVAQCFFAVSAAIAAFRLGPWNIDPLNGYALLFIATIGFIPPVFTLMLLRSQNRREWYHIFVVLLSWILSTTLFFILIGNLQDVRNDTQRVAQARNALYSVDACGGYSAMSLCTETGKIDPIYYMMGFFNQDAVPNIDNIWVIWLFPFLVLLVLSIHRFFPRFLTRIVTSTKNAATNKYANRYTSTINNSRKPLLILAMFLFVLCFLYQIFLVKKYVEMDLIDTRTKTGWTFGQIVAVLIWAPSLFELTIGWFLEWLKERREERKSHHTHGYAAVQASMAQRPAGSALYHHVPSASGQTPLLSSTQVGTPMTPSTPNFGNQSSVSPPTTRPTTPVAVSAYPHGNQSVTSPTRSNHVIPASPVGHHQGVQSPVSTISTNNLTHSSSVYTIPRRPVPPSGSMRP